MKYRKKLEIVEVVQWLKPGDHPKVTKHLTIFPDDKCTSCKKLMKSHGWLKIKASDYNLNLVCPGNWIVQNKDEIIASGVPEFNIYNTNTFNLLYEPEEEEEEEEDDDIIYTTSIAEEPSDDFLV